jgi:general secretion pathway protein K
VPRPLRSPHREGSRGVALIAVLCVIVLLMGLALSVTQFTRRHASLARRSFEALQSQELADSAIRLAVLSLSSPLSPPQGSNVGGSELDIFGRLVVVRYEWESGRVDLNFASRDLLAAVFAGNSIPESDAYRLADRIIDWRDVDDDRQSQGAERQDYLQFSRNSGPRNGPFENVTELMQVLDFGKMDTEFLDAFTVYSHSPDVSENRAPLAVIHALRWADAKQLGGRRWLAEKSGIESAEARSVAGDAVRLRACVTPSKAPLCRVAIVRFTGNPQQPTQALAWYTEYQHQPS